MEHNTSENQYEESCKHGLQFFIKIKLREAPEK